MRDAAATEEVLGVRGKRRIAILTAAGKEINLVRSAASHAWQRRRWKRRRSNMTIREEVVVVVLLE